MRFLLFDFMIFNDEILPVYLDVSELNLIGIDVGFNYFYNIFIKKTRENEKLVSHNKNQAEKIKSLGATREN